MTPWVAGPRLAWCLASATVVGASLLVMLAHPTGPARPDDAPHLGRGEPFIVLEPGRTVSQVAVASADDLSEISVRLGTFGGAERCSLELRVLDGDVDAAALAQRTVPCRDVPDVGLLPVRLPPQPDSSGQRYQLELTLTPDSEDRLVTWAARPVDSLPPSEVGGVQADKASEVRLGYGDEVPLVERLGTVLRRAQQYRPAWVTTPTILLAAAAVCLAVVLLPLVPRRRLGAVVIGIVVVKGLCWASLLPLLEAPDEHSHYAYVQRLAEDGALPRKLDRPIEQDPDHYSPELEIADRLLHTSELAPDDRPAFGNGVTGPREDALRRLDGSADGNITAAGYSPAYYLPAAGLYRLVPHDFVTRFSVVRLWSVALSAVAVWFVWRAGLRCFVGDAVSAAALCLAVGFNPLWSQQLASVNNDALLVAAGGACLLIALQLAAGASRRAPLLAGLAIGAAALAKPFGVLIAPGVAAGWLVGRLRRERDRWRGAAHDIALAAAGFAATFGTWVVIRTVLGVPDARLATEGALPGGRSASDYVEMLTSDRFGELRSRWVDGLWTRLSWLDTSVGSTGLAGVIALLTVTALVAGGLALARWPRSREVGARGRLAVCCLTTAGAVIGLHAVELAYFVDTGHRVLQGRYLLFVLPAVLAIPPLALERFAGWRWRRATMVCLAGAVLVFHGLAVATLAERFYV